MPKIIERKPLTTERQRELQRILQESFATYDERYNGPMHFYGLMGMSTDSVLRHVMEAPITALTIFWPKELIQERYNTGRTFLLEDGAMAKAMSNVRSTLDQLVDRGWVEKVGNEHERRWRPTRDPKDSTKG